MAPDACPSICIYIILSIVLPSNVDETWYLKSLLLVACHNKIWAYSDLSGQFISLPSCKKLAILKKKSSVILFGQSSWIQITNLQVCLYSFMELFVKSVASDGNQESILISYNTVISWIASSIWWHVCSELASFMMNVCWLMSVYGSLHSQKHLAVWEQLWTESANMVCWIAVFLFQ